MDILDFSDIDFISIHAPRAGSDDVSDQRWTDIYKFQSTPPVRGATRRRHAQDTKANQISIHAPRAGGDQHCTSFIGLDYIFQSTPPVRGATPDAHFIPRSHNGFQSTPPVRGATMLRSG